MPLLELFIRLRKAGLPLGMNEYQLALQALQGGFGIADRAALKRLCRILWVKSADEGHLFDHHFEQLMPLPAEALPEISPDPSLLPLSPRPAPPNPLPVTPSEKPIIEIDDEIQVAQAVKQPTSIDDEIYPTHYTSSDEYFPVTRRQMKQSWRYLRRPVREGPPVELDVAATVNEVGRKGMLQPILVPRRINHAELLLLIDHGGSMVPFHMISHRLVETILRGGRLEKVTIYYFHNCPVEYLYRDPFHQKYEAIEEILDGRYSQRTSVLVFSDAGAARGGFNSERCDLTEKFLQQFKQQFRYIAWLNPMPRSRWLDTTAGKVMQSVSMFDLSRRGLDDAISVLRGRPSRYIPILR